MAKCKVCGGLFGSLDPKDELCITCERAVERLKGYAEPVRHGKWTDPEDDDGGTEWHCSECSFTVQTLVWYPRYRFCPKCGARMDREN